jgi:hypothetical protein
MTAIENEILNDLAVLSGRVRAACQIHDKLKNELAQARLDLSKVQKTAPVMEEKPEEFEIWANEYSNKIMADTPRGFREHLGAEVHTALCAAFRHLTAKSPAPPIEPGEQKGINIPLRMPESVQKYLETKIRAYHNALSFKNGAVELWEYLAQLPDNHHYEDGPDRKDPTGEQKSEIPEGVDKNWEERKIDRLAEVISMSEDHIRELQGEVSDWKETASLINREGSLVQAKLSAAIEEIQGYKEMHEDHKRLVWEIDVIINGEAGAAKQASLCDLVGQIQKLAENKTPKLDDINVADLPRTSINQRLAKDFCLNISVTSDLIPENEGNLRVQLSEALVASVYQVVGRLRNTGVSVEEINPEIK